MLYFKNNQNEKILENVNKNDINFASIKKMEDGSLEIIHNNDHLLLGPCGGITYAQGKFEKYDCFDRDLDEFDSVVQNEIYSILNGDVDVINLG